MKNKYMNLQLFAEGAADGEAENEGEGKTSPGKPDNDELAKLKEEFKKLSAENSELKKKERSRLTEEEKKKLESEEREKEYADLRRELNLSKVEKTFAESGLTSEEYSEIAELIVKEEVLTSDDKLKLSSAIAKLVKERETKAIDLSQTKELKTNTMFPKGESGKETSIAARLAKSKAVGNETDIKKLYV